mmetsp:Transcript_16490/g.26673  ORF Transcript_16490/g.26673 Transcript_16490/m.26673 type:complete len:221 (+) Transcript_16490:146-808(+)
MQWRTFPPPHRKLVLHWQILHPSHHHGRLPVPVFGRGGRRYRPPYHDVRPSIRQSGNDERAPILADASHATGPRFRPPSQRSSLGARPADAAAGPVRRRLRHRHELVDDLLPELPRQFHNLSPRLVPLAEGVHDHVPVLPEFRQGIVVPARPRVDGAGTRQALLEGVPQVGIGFPIHPGYVGGELFVLRGGTAAVEVRRREGVQDHAVGFELRVDFGRQR